MHDTHCVSRVEHAHDRRENLKRFASGETSAGLEFVIECVTFHILHHHVDSAVGGCAKIVNSYRIWMAKAAGGLTFATESSQPLRIVSDFRGKDFDSHAIAEQDMSRAINRTHPAFAQQRFHLILPVEHRVDDGGGIGFQHLAVNRTEAHAVVVFGFAGGAVFHSGTLSVLV